MLLGQFESKIGEKKRLAVPKKFRSELGSKLILTKGFEKCLVIVNEKAWGDITSDIASASYGLQELRDASRFLVGSATEFTADSQGRFVLPDYLKEYAEIKGEVLFIGLMRWVEIWDKGSWEKKSAEIEKENIKTARKLSDLLRKE